MALRLVFCVVWCVACVTLVPVAWLLAQEEQVQDTVPSTIASPFQVDGEVQDGDIVSYDVEQNVYQPARQTGDRNMFGVVVDDPVLFVDDGIEADGVRPIVRFGEAVVNVSTLNGPIRAGDLVTTSRIVGVGQRMDPADATYILGVATAGMVMGGERIEVDGADVVLGRVPVALRIGYFSDGDEDAALEELRALYASSAAAVESSIEAQDAERGLDLFLLFRYLLGAFVATASIVLALRRFGGLFNESVVAVGRNPLAHSQVRNLLIWNTFMIISVSGVGLLFGILIVVI